MIEAVEAYIENIVGLMIVTALAEMIMPESSFKKYARLITGLVIVVAVSEPAVRLIYGRGFDFELKEVHLSQYADEQKRTVNDIYIKEIEKKVYDLAEDRKIEISDIRIKNGREKIDEMEVYLAPGHSCIEVVAAYGEEKETCTECKEEADMLRDTLKGETGLKNVDVIILKE